MNKKQKTIIKNSIECLEEHLNFLEENRKEEEMFLRKNKKYIENVKSEIKILKEGL